MTELQVSLPPECVIGPDSTERLLLDLANQSVPTAFEMFASPEEITTQFAVRETDADQATQHIKSHLPESWIYKTDNGLRGMLDPVDSNKGFALWIFDFGLRRHAVRPIRTLRSFDPDPLMGLVSGLSGLELGEACVYQVLFQAVREDWHSRFLENLTNQYGKPRYLESKELLSCAAQKFAYPLLSASIRFAIRATSRERAVQISRGMTGTFRAMSSPNSNEVVALANRSISTQKQQESFIHRTSYRSGMLLNTSELAGLTHLPSASVKCSKLKRVDVRTKSSPELTSDNQLILGENNHRGITQNVTLSNEHRSRHTHLIGSSGSGKSTLLLHLILQDLAANQGLCVIDPHGDLFDSVVANIPESRTKDVILFDASDAQFPVGFNILQASSLLEKNLLSSDLVATFRRMSTSWGDVMDSVLANAILAFIESTRGGTLFDLKRFLVEKDFREEFLLTVNDEGVVYFWRNEFPLITGKPQASILVRLDAFLRQGLIRNIVCQKENRIDFRHILDNRKILLIKLSQGLIGEENAYLLGTMLVSRIYQAALSRQDTQDRPHFWLYLDEFHHFITPSMERILSGTRKYNLGLTLAHQEFRQMQSRSQDVASSVLTNCYTRVCFRLGDADSDRFASGFSSFDAKALQNLGVGEAIARVERADYDFNLNVPPVPRVEESLRLKRTESVVTNSRKLFARDRLEVEAEISTSIFRKTANKTENSISGRDGPSEKKLEKELLSKRPNEHRYLQTVVKRLGEDNGFISTIEKEVFGGIGRIDVALEREDLRIAVEVADTNTTTYEAQNIQKCMSAGFDQIVVVSSSKAHLNSIRKQAEMIISPVHFSKVHFLEPENLHLFLESTTCVRENEDIKHEKVKGYLVRTIVEQDDSASNEAKQRVIRDILDRSARRRKRSTR